MLRIGISLLTRVGVSDTGGHSKWTLFSTNLVLEGVQCCSYAKNAFDKRTGNAKKSAFPVFLVDTGYLKMKNGGNLNILFLYLRNFVKQQCIGCLSTNYSYKVPYTVSYSISLRFACCIPASRKKNIKKK